MLAQSKQDIERVVQWFQGLSGFEEQLHAGTASWQQFYRACDGFDDRRAYICVIDENPQATDDDWNAFANMAWDLVIDFDVKTDESGAFSKSYEVLSKIRSLKLTPLENELPVIGPGASLWVAARGVSRRPTTVKRELGGSGIAVSFPTYARRQMLLRKSPT